MVLPDGIEPPSPVLQTGANPSQLEKRNLEEGKRVELLQPIKAINGFKPPKHAACDLP